MKVLNKNFLKTYIGKFIKRREHKKSNSPLEQAYKLILNSSCSKIIQKPIENKTLYMNNNDGNKWDRKN